jgi:hypothetical protein
MCDYHHKDRYSIFYSARVRLVSLTPEEFGASVRQGRDAYHDLNVILFICAHCVYHILRILPLRQRGPVIKSSFDDTGKILDNKFSVELFFSVFRPFNSRNRHRRVTRAHGVGWNRLRHSTLTDRNRLDNAKLQNKTTVLRTFQSAEKENTGLELSTQISKTVFFGANQKLGAFA